MGRAGAGQEEEWERKEERADSRTLGLDLGAFLGGVGWPFFGPSKNGPPRLRGVSFYYKHVKTSF